MDIGNIKDDIAGNINLFNDLSNSCIQFFRLCTRHKILKTSFLPVYITGDNRPEVVSPCHENGKKIVSIMAKVCKEYGSEVVVAAEGGKVILKG